MPNWMTVHLHSCLEVTVIFPKPHIGIMDFFLYMNLSSAAGTDFFMSCTGQQVTGELCSTAPQSVNGSAEIVSSDSLSDKTGLWFVRCMAEA